MFAMSANEHRDQSMKIDFGSAPELRLIYLIVAKAIGPLPTPSWTCIVVYRRPLLARSGTSISIKEVFTPTIPALFSSLIIPLVPSSATPGHRVARRGGVCAFIRSRTQGADGRLVQKMVPLRLETRAGHACMALENGRIPLPARTIGARRWTKRGGVSVGQWAETAGGAGRAVVERCMIVLTG